MPQKLACLIRNKKCVLIRPGGHFRSANSQPLDSVRLDSLATHCSRLFASRHALINKHSAAILTAWRVNIRSWIFLTNNDEFFNWTLQVRSAAESWWSCPKPRINNFWRSRFCNIWKSVEEVSFIIISRELSTTTLNIRNSMFPRAIIDRLPASRHVFNYASAGFQNRLILSIRLLF